MRRNDQIVSVERAYSKIESNKSQLKPKLKEKAKWTMLIIVPSASLSAVIADLSEPSSYPSKHAKTQGGNE